MGRPKARKGAVVVGARAGQAFKRVREAAQGIYRRWRGRSFGGGGGGDGDGGGDGGGSGCVTRVRELVR